MSDAVKVMEQDRYIKASRAIRLSTASHTGVEVPFSEPHTLNRADRDNNYRLRGYGSECVLHPCDGNHIYTYKI